MVFAIPSTVLSAGLNLAGSALGAFGQSQANAQAASNVAAQIAFQDRMSRTAYQRAVKDLRKAGLNPMLAYGKPASTPSGAAAPVINELGAAGEGLRATARQVAEIELLKAQREKTENETRSIQQGVNILSPVEEIRHPIGAAIDWIKDQFGIGRTNAKEVETGSPLPPQTNSAKSLKYPEPLEGESPVQYFERVVPKYAQKRKLTKKQEDYIAQGKDQWDMVRRAYRLYRQGEFQDD